MARKVEQSRPKPRKRQRIGAKPGHRCSICNHARFEEISADLIGEEFYRNIAARYGVAISSLSRHAQHTTETEIAQANVKRAKQSKPLLDAGNAYDALGQRKNGVQIQRFVDELLATPDWNMTKAALAAGYAPGSAADTGSRLMKDEQVRAAVLERLAARKQRLEVNQDQILLELVMLANATITDFIEWEEDGRARMVASKRLGDKARAIQSLRIDQDGIVRDIRLISRDGILRALLAHVQGKDPDGSSKGEIVVRTPSGESVLVLPGPHRNT